MAELYFSQIREDGRAERAVVAAAGARRVACIGSGGCTMLSLLDDDLTEMMVADANPAQCALIELKMAGLREFDRDRFLAFIGDRPDPRRSSAYRTLRLLLSEAARKYWDKRIDDIVAGINQIGVTERYYDFVGRSVRNSLISPGILEKLFTADSNAVQEALFEEYFDTERWCVAMRILLSKQSQLLFYPAFWYAQAGEHEFEQLFLPHLMEALRSRPASDNYFLSQLFLGRYLNPDRGGAPHYLSKEGYAAAQRNLDKVRVVNLPIQAMLARERDIDAFFLSNIFDWGKPVHARDVWTAVLGSASKEASFLYRNMYRRSEIPDDVSDRIRIIPAASRDFQAQERSMLYRHIQAGTIH